VFMSERSLTGYDNRDAVSGVLDEEVYLYDAEATRVLMRVSIGQHSPAGYGCDATGIFEEGYDCDGNTEYE
jgi:hypothetical protein